MEDLVKKNTESLSELWMTRSQMVCIYTHTVYTVRLTLFVLPCLAQLHTVSLSESILYNLLFSTDSEFIHSIYQFNVSNYNFKNNKERENAILTSIQIVWQDEVMK